MKVLHLSHTATVSGAERSLLILMAAIPPECRAGLACPSGDLAERARESGIPVFNTTELNVSLRVSPRDLPASGLRALRVAWAVRQAARRTGATVIHGNSSRASVIAIAARALGGPPVVAHLRDALPRKTIPLLVNRMIRRCSHTVVANSGYVAEKFGERNLGGAPVTVIQNPVELKRFPASRSAGEAFRQEFTLAPDVPLLGVIGQITSWKGHDTAIRALAELRPPREDVKLLIVGAIKFAGRTTRLDNQAYLDFLRAEVRRLDLEDRVEFIGEREDIPSVLAALDVLLVPSLEEPFGRTVVEAMAAGTPVVATSVGGPAEIIEPGITGLLVTPGDSHEWAKAIEKLLDDRSGAAAMAKRARAVAGARFDEGKHAQQMLQVLKSASS